MAIPKLAAFDAW